MQRAVDSQPDAPPTQQDLAPFVEWGGPVWAAQVQRGLTWVGDLTGLRVLEIGSRYGGMATRLALLGAQVTGLEVSNEPLERARATAAAYGMSDRVRFDVYSGDPRDLPRGYDVVFSKSTLVLMPDLDMAIAGITASLGVGGRLLLIENARGPLPVHLARMLIRRSMRPHGAAYFTRRAVRRIGSHLDIELERWTLAPPTVLVGAVKRSS